MLKKIVILSSIFLVFSMHAGSAAEQARSLNEKEMAVPSGRYQQGVDINHQCRVNMDLPEFEPVLLTTVRPECIWLQNVLVDSEGGIWYGEGPKGYFTNKIIRLKPDGTLNWEKELSPEPVYADAASPSDPKMGLNITGRLTYVFPAVACEGAMIIFVGFEELKLTRPDAIGDAKFDDIYTAHLQCIDLDGNTRWVTEPVKLNREFMSAWRISGDRIAMTSSENDFDVYSIADGKHMETVKTPGWSPLSNTGPIATNDDGWILHGDNDTEKEAGGYPYIYRMNHDGSYAWKDDYSQYSFSFNLTVGDDGSLVYGNHNSLRLIDPRDGSEKWRLEGGFYRADGEMYEGNYMAINTATKDDKIEILDSNGKILRLIDCKNPIGLVDGVIIFRNGLIFGDANGITCVDNNGSIKWIIDRKDLGVPDTFKTYSGYWTLNPTSDGGLVALGRDPVSKDPPLILYVFEPGKLPQ